MASNPDSYDLLTQAEIKERDGVGNIKRKEILTGENSYGYDALYQLKNFKDFKDRITSYEYDYAGNREELTLPDGSKTYYTNPANKLATISAQGNVTNIGYDSRGNMTNKGTTTTYTWDYKDRLAGVQTASKAITYKYRNDDLRIVRSDGTKTVHYIYNGTQLLAEKTEAGKIVKTYTNDSEGPLGFTRWLYDASGNELRRMHVYQLFDDLGNVTMLTNDVGLPLTMYLYDPWGNITNVTYDPANNHTFVGRYGGYKDWDTNLTYFWHRWYDGEIGRWISRDPIGERSDSANLYQYAHNNSANLVDYNGLFTCLYQQKAKDKVQIGALSADLFSKCECIANCMGIDMIITGGAEKSGHDLVKSEHYVGNAIDFGWGGNPTIGPKFTGMEKKTLCCARKCGFNCSRTERKNGCYHIETGTKTCHGGCGSMPSAAECTK